MPSDKHTPEETMSLRSGVERESFNSGILYVESGYWKDLPQNPEGPPA